MQRWRPAQRIDTNGLPIPSALVENMMARDINEQDYGILLQLDKYTFMHSQPYSISVHIIL